MVEVEKDEKILGKIPSVMILPYEYTVFVTTKRLIFNYRISHVEIEESNDLFQKIGSNELSYVNITKVEIKKDWVHYWYHLTIWGLTKKMKEKKLVTGNLLPPFLYEVDNELRVLSKKEAARKYAIETMKLLSSVLKDKIVKGSNLQNNAFSLQPSIYFSYPELEDKDEDKKRNEIRKRREKNAKIERVQQVLVGIIATIGGLILLIGGYWLSNIGICWGLISGMILMFLGGTFVVVGIGGPILRLLYV